MELWLNLSFMFTHPTEDKRKKVIARDGTTRAIADFFCTQEMCQAVGMSLRDLERGSVAYFMRRAPEKATLRDIRSLTPEAEGGCVGRSKCTA